MERLISEENGLFLSLDHIEGLKAAARVGDAPGWGGVVVDLYYITVLYCLLIHTPEANAAIVSASGCWEGRYA